METKLASSLALVIKIDKVSMYALTKHAQIYCISEKERKKKIKDFLRDMCRTAVDAEALWKRSLENP